MPPHVVDADQRAQALDPTRSFIVQAPAGSGKTELLTQRTLALLATVQAPEEVIAITFTRKAAGEMRARILTALHRAASGEQATQEHEQTTLELATRVLAQSRSLGWELESSPSRLRIQTIDALCAALVRRMPLLSRLGGQAAVSEQPEELYMQAARATVEEMDQDSAWTDSIQTLLRHLDNNVDQTCHLIADMLARRDQWLRHLADPNSRRLQRHRLERSLNRAIEETLQEVRSLIPQDQISPLLRLARFAASNLSPDSTDLDLCTQLSDLPGPDSHNHPAWAALAELMLTKEGRFRKQATKNQGFPAPSSSKDPQAKALYQDMKDLFGACTSALRTCPQLEDRLHQVRHLPPPEYAPAQWEIMEALFEVLRLAVGQLHLVFQDQGEVDFAEITSRAQIALGSPDDPTDLALVLDNRIQHLLMDEFQDTSISQFRLLEGLTAGWTPGDGRTFFAVGDPMQSIYSFREAEVGLFLLARQHGLGHIPLTPLTLAVNFRSQAGVVDWVNTAFPQVLPPVEDPLSGSVPYSPSRAFQAASSSPAVQVHPFLQADADAEAVVSVIIEAQARDPEQSIAVLVRSRSHLRSIMPRLRQAGLRFQAVDIDPLAQRPVIQDLGALTKALRHPGHRLAWLAVLRAPWAGLCLQDLHQLAPVHARDSVLDSLAQDQVLARLSPQGRQQIERILPILQAAVEHRDRVLLSRQVQSCWQALGGPDCLHTQAETDDAEVFFQLLRTRFDPEPHLAVDELDQAVTGLFARPDTAADHRLQVMTIHRAKGLEFDTVIFPGLGRKPQAPEQQLLLWLERSAPDGQSDLLLAPRKETGQAPDPVYTYLQHLIQRKNGNEDGRLLYVACTRAKKHLHLLGHTTVDKNGALRPPASGSLLASLWPAVESEFARAQPPAQEPSSQAQDKQADQTFYRLSPSWQPPVLPSGLGRTQQTDTQSRQQEHPIFDWAGEMVRCVGTCVHGWLVVMAKQGLGQWPVQRVADLQPALAAQLQRLGLKNQEVDQGSELAVQALERTLQDTVGLWILQDHVQAANEYALSGQVNGQVLSVVMDRTFVDRQGVRWIIDYKTSRHQGGDREGFLNREQERYQEQMQTYAQLMQATEDRPIRLGLYFPLLSGWRTWDFSRSSPG